MKLTLTSLTTIILLFGASFANAYFVRPFVQINTGGLIDGFVENGPTQSSQNFTSDFTSAVDLADGTVKAYLDMLGTFGNAQTGGSFGDTVTFQNAFGTTVDFNFDFDGFVTTGAVVPPNPFQVGVFANLYVYEAGVVSGSNFTDTSIIDQALISESIFDQSLSVGNLNNFLYSNSLSGSIDVGIQTDFDVFASLAVFASNGSTPTPVTMDFRNTGTFGIQTASGVNFTSQSGVFLQGNAPPPAAVPEPTTLLLFGTGLAGLAGFARKKKN